MNICAEDDLIIYAAKNYDNPNCQGADEFYSDLSIPSHLKKLFTRYGLSGELKYNLVINHIVCFYNVFLPQAGTRILFYKIDKKHHSILKTFLIFLGRISETTTFKDLDLINIPIDKEIMTILRNNV